ncbi:MAG TPA: YicC/YloC family endoribonuclease [Syntrophorhabdales bacterium]|nr:YicC/YloC family endoribonuclease [Syntrophorhabdales bacterium]
MPKSMTGFSRAETETADGKCSGEARSLNSRYLEVSLKLPKSAAAYEQRLRELAKKQVKRGRLDVTVKWERSGAGNALPTLNEEAIRWYLDVARRLKETYGVQGDLTLDNILNAKDIIVYEENSVPEGALYGCFDTLLAKLNEDRDREGELIRQDLLAHLEKLVATLSEVEQRWPSVIKKHEETLREKVQKVIQASSIDESRILQEIAIYMERVDIAEEISRLKGHLAHFRQTLDGADEMGRKLDFTIQEMVRETNTIGSKSNDLYISERVILIKVEIEKMREQVQNVE